jgi:hypothetical protein
MSVKELSDLSLVEHDKGHRSSLCWRCICCKSALSTPDRLWHVHEGATLIQIAPKLIVSCSTGAAPLENNEKERRL